MQLCDARPLQLGGGIACPLQLLATANFSDFLRIFIEHLLDEITYSGTQLILAST